MQLKADVLELYHSLQATTQTSDQFVISEDHMPDFLTNQCENEEPAPKTSKKGTEYKEEHYEMFRRLNEDWPPQRTDVIDGCFMNYDLMHPRVAELAICMQRMYNDATHLSTRAEFFDGNNSLKRVLSWDDEKCSRPLSMRGGLGERRALP